MAAVKVVIADDHSIWRTGLRADLGENFTVVGEAADAKEAIAVIEATDPDLVLSDLNMPEGGGIALVKAIGGKVPVVMLTVSEAESDLLDAIAAGALGYLVKSTNPDELREQLWKASKGEPVFSASLAALVLTEFRRLHKAEIPGEALSEREREVLQYVARGHTYKAVSYTHLTLPTICSV